MCTDKSFIIDTAILHKNRNGTFWFHAFKLSLRVKLSHNHLVNCLRASHVSRWTLFALSPLWVGLWSWHHNRIGESVPLRSLFPTIWLLQNLSSALVTVPFPFLGKNSFLFCSSLELNLCFNCCHYLM